MSLTPDLNLFEVGSLFRRTDIHDAFGGQRQGGISTPANHPFILLFTGENGNAYGYRDEWKDDGFFHYTGEGRTGDMKMSRGNLGLLKHAENGKMLMLFAKMKDGRHRFSGYMECVGYYEQAIPDANRSLRRGLVFKLMAIGPELSFTGAEKPLEFDRATLESLRGKAIEASSYRVDKETRLSVYRARSRAVAAYALKRAHGFCEGCGRPAPFLRRDGMPYLEAHHTHRVSDEGPDSPSHVMALCPTCHRRVHHACDGAAYNDAISDVPIRIEEALSLTRAKVVGAALILDSYGRVFVAQRAAGDLAGQWEFPGGKLLDGEDPVDGVKREIQEELHADISEIEPFVSVDHDYGVSFIRLLCFTCRTSDELQVAVHSAGQWVHRRELGRVPLAPADARVAQYIGSRSCRCV